MTEDALIQHITQAIAERFNPRRIVLFGSRTRGDARPDSDVDIFVEMETEASPPERVAEVSSLFGLRPWSLDVVVYTPREVENLRRVHGTLPALVEAEGRVLYERP
jgi:predicted nucleotidyltransferase